MSDPTPGPSSPTVTRAADGDREVLAATLTRAFADDPVIQWMFPDDATRPVRTERMFRVYLRDTMRGGEVYTTPELNAASMWKPPGKWKLDNAQLVRQLPALVQAFGRRLPALLEFEKKVETPHPTDPHWYLAVIGTDPVAQGNGIGAALMHEVLDRCDRQGEAAYLESSKPDNVPYYERFGFKVTGEATLGKRNDGATLWFMWRDPQVPED